MEKLSAENKKPLSDSIENIERSSRELIGTLEDVRKVSVQLESLIENLEHGEGTMGKMVRDPGLYHDHTDTMGRMNYLIQDIKENPDKYISVSIF